MKCEINNVRERRGEQSLLTRGKYTFLEVINVERKVLQLHALFSFIASFSEPKKGRKPLAGCYRRKRN